MKIFIVGDVHWSQYSSIVRSRGERFSTRLENCIKSVNWAEREAENQHCEIVVYLGDFFDKSELNAEEITAMQEIEWSKIPHQFLCGNHEMGDKFHNSSSLKVFGEQTISRPSVYTHKDFQLLYLPYITEDNRLEFSEYVKQYCVDRTPIYVFSHNDLKIQYGAYTSANGFDTEDINANCEFFFNGHLHNRTLVSPVIQNVGNLTGQNFSEDATLYQHGAVILDTEENMWHFVENPYAFHFYKLTDDMIAIPSCKKAIALGSLSANPVVSMTCYAETYDEVREWLDNQNAIYRIQIKRDLSNISTEVQEEKVNNIDHISKFREYVLANIGNDEDTRFELDKISE